MRRALGVLALLPAWVRSYATTDSIQDADPAQSGYLPNHNMDPNIVGGSSFGVQWSFPSSNNQETWYAKPLTYTLSGGSEMVITASNMNVVRVHDKNGTLIAQRTLNPPFLQSDIGCGDIPNYIGVTGTPIIDPATNTIYMLAKGYKNGQASGGVANGIYQMYALSLPGLGDAPGFPLLIDGNRADNDPTRYFVGGTVLQRPSLTTINGAIVAAFGGHCDLFNYTGMILSVSKTPGRGVVSLYAMEASPGAPKPQPLDITVEKGGKAGIWQSGMGIATDGNRIFVTTGNGQGHANGDVPASGRFPLSTLDECVANFAVSSTGVFSLSDYFEPYDYVQMDAADKDLGSSGTSLLDASTFRTSTINRMAVTVGKNGKVYVTNADNLGGFKQGPGGTDNIIQTITASNSVFGGAGSYPLESGYFYFTPVGDYTYAYKMGLDGNGQPFFSQAGKTPTMSAGRAGVGPPTITTNGGRPGTGILWITDVNVGLRAFRAVPDGSGVLQPINLPATPGLNKFQRPAFGDGRVYVTANNKIICLGYPVNLPINCTGPIDFGQVQTGATQTMMVTCQANIALTRVNGCSTVDKTFQCSNSSLPQGAVAAGSTFSFPVTWNLTQKSINDAQNVSFGKVIPGVESTVLDIYTTNSQGGFSTDIPVSLSGSVVSADPFLFASPKEVDFGGIVLGTATAADGLSGSVQIQNVGNSTLTFTGMAWQFGNDTTGSFTNLTFAGKSADLGNGFTSADFPSVGSTLAPGQGLAVPLKFSTSASGSFSVNVWLWSDGGVADILLTASAGNPPIASIAVSTVEGGWDNSDPVHMAFGNVLAGKTVVKKIQICNVGGSVLSITKSKPPTSPQLAAVSPFGEFLEGQKIDVNTCANASVAVYAAPVQPNHPQQYISLTWTLNTDGLNANDRSQPFGVHDVLIDVTIVSRQVGPVLADGSARYQWVGCFQDTGMGRNLQNQMNNAALQANNTNEQCQTTCLNAGFSLAGTEYSKECWCGNKIKYPQTFNNASSSPCTFSCTGDNTESCGGDGGYMSLYADVTKFNIAAFYASLNASATTTTAATSASSTGTGTVASPTSTASGSPLNPNEPAVVNNQWNYIGCYKDLVNGLRSLSSSSSASDTMSLESCATFCSSYNFFGGSYGRECYCGYTLDATLKASEGDCATQCVGNTAELCGSGGRLSVYNNTVYKTPPPSPSHVARSGNYSWLGCYTEATSGRALTGASYASDLMSVDSCAAFCNTKNFQMMGVEFGRECYCGNSTGPGVGPTTTTDCKTLCKNNTLQYCGAGSRLDFYTLSAVTSSTTSSSSLGTSSTSVSVSTTSTSSSVLSSSTSSSSALSTTSSSSSSSTDSSQSSTTSTISSTQGTSTSSSTTSDGTASSSLQSTNSQSPSTSESSTTSLSTTTGPESVSSTTISSVSSDASTSTSSDTSTSSTISTSTSSQASTSQTSSTESTSSTSTSSSSSSSPTSSSSTSSSSSTISADAGSSSSTSNSESPSTSSSVSSSTSSSISSSTSTSTSSSTTLDSPSTSSSVSSSTSSSVSSSTSSSVSSSTSSSVSSSTSSSVSSSTSSSVSSSTSTSVSSSTSSTGPASASATTTQSLSSVSSTSTLTVAGPTATNGYYYIGCFQDTSSGHALPQLVANKSVTPELCIDYANSIYSKAPTPTKRLPYLYVEYHQECYGGATFDFMSSAVTSLTGTKACSDVCSGSVRTFTTNGVVSVTTGTANMCGGAKQFNLYALSTTVDFPTTGGPVTTKKA